MPGLVKFPALHRVNTSPVAPTEQKSMVSDEFSRMLAWAYGGAPGASGISVNPDTAMRCAAVYACVRVLAESVAQLPLIVYRRTGAGKERAPDHPLYSLLHDAPNEWQTSFEFRETCMAHLALRGNAYALKNVVAGRVRELLPISPDRVSVTQNADWSLSYTVSKPSGGSETLSADKVFHLRGLSANGYLGLSPIQLAREAVGLSLATEKHGATLFANGARTSGVITHPKNLSAPAQQRLKDSIEEATTGDNLHRLVVLEEDMKWTSVGMTSEDSQFLATREYQRSEIAAIFRIPPHLIGDLAHATFSNIEQQALEFVTYTMLPWLKRWEQRITMDLIAPKDRDTVFAEFNVDGLLRGDMASRYQSYMVAIQNGILNPNEVREMENRNPREGGDLYLTPLNMTTDPTGTATDTTTPDTTTTPLKIVKSDMAP